MTLHLPSMITSERLVLRGYRPADAPELFAAARRNRSHFERFESGNILMSLSTLAETEAAIEEMAQGWARGQFDFLGIFDKTAGSWVGQVYIGWVNRELPEFEIGYVVDADCQGKGYISEAVHGALKVLFIELGAHRVSLRCSDANIRSQQVAERGGFTLEGRLRQTRLLLDGSYEGQYIYGQLRSEFKP